MRLIIPFLFYSFFTSGQIDLNKQITIHFDSIQLGEALQALSEAASMPFAYSYNIYSKRYITSQFKEVKLGNILNDILREEKVGYSIRDNQLLFFIENNPEIILSGFVQDKYSGEKLSGASIFNKEHGIGVSTNEYGFFSIILPRNVKHMEVRYLGYHEFITPLTNIQDAIQIHLIPFAYSSEEIIIPEKVFAYPGHNEDHSIQLSQNFNEVSPSLAGENDYVRNTHLLSGINSANDGLGGINVRGGEDGHNLFLLDGVPIYIPYHLLGAYSVYNSSAIKSAKVVKGHFPARYGGRISSIYDVWAKEGSKHKWKTQADANLSIVKLLVEGPIKKNKSSMLIAGRIAPRDFLFEPTFRKIYFQSQVNPVNSKFYDVHAKFNFEISEKDRLHLNFYRGYDSFNSEEAIEIEGLEEQDEIELKFNWHNTVSSAKWNRHINANCFINTTATYSTYGYSYRSLNLFGAQNNTNNDFFYLNSTSANRDTGIRTDIDLILSRSHLLKFGSGYTHRRFQPSLAFFDESDEETNEVETTVASLSELATGQLYNVSELYAYVEDDIQLATNISAQIGLRFSSFYSFDENFLQFEPRISLRWAPSDKYILRGSVNRLNQYLHLINNIALRLPNDLWIPSSKNIRPQSSWQYELSLSSQLSEKFQVTSEIYYKDFQNLYAYPDDFALFNNIDQLEPADYLTRGEGRSIGWETTLNYQTDKIGGFFSYTLADARRTYENQNLGLAYPFEYDYRHQFKLFVQKKWSNNFQISLQGIYFSPNPEISLTAVQSEQGLVNFDNNPKGQRNQIRGKAYFRIDFGITYNLFKSYGLHIFQFGLFNLSDRKNIAFQKIDFDTNNQPISSQVNSFPLLPSLRYSIRF